MLHLGIGYIVRWTFNFVIRHLCKCIFVKWKAHKKFNGHIASICEHEHGIAYHMVNKSIGLEEIYVHSKLFASFHHEVKMKFQTSFFLCSLRFSRSVLQNILNFKIEYDKKKNARHIFKRFCSCFFFRCCCCCFSGDNAIWHSPQFSNGKKYIYHSVAGNIICSFETIYIPLI